MIGIALKNEVAERLIKLLKEQKWKEFQKEVREFHPFDLSEFIHNLEEGQRREVLTMLEPKIVAEFFPELKEEVQAELLELLAPGSAAELLKNIQPDEAVDVLTLLIPEKRNNIIKYLPEELQKDIRLLLPYPPDTAGGLMTTKVLALSKDIAVREAEKYIRENAKNFETIYYLYVVDINGKLVGVLSLRDLMLAPEDKKLEEIMESNVIKVTLHMDQKEVAKIVADYDLAAVPVVDREGKLTGIVTVDDVVDIIEEEIVEDMGQLAGTGVKIDWLVDAPVREVVKARLPWLFVALVGDGLVTSTIIKHFTNILGSVIAFSLFVPVIMTMGGNVGLQTSTTFVRAIAIKDIGGKMSYMLREIKIGFTMGLIAGSITAIFSYLLVGQPVIGLIVGFAMLCAMSLASSMGVFIPAILERLGIDPPLASGPFMTTIQDITSLMVYFSLATIFFSHVV
ncbi:magnesium transporter MgtE [archaeon BMS3Bbin15]|nr:magnesium transporter MgtE [archaeon BMS3Bbin15]